MFRSSSSGCGCSFALREQRPRTQRQNTHHAIPKIKTAVGIVAVNISEVGPASSVPVLGGFVATLLVWCFV